MEREALYRALSQVNENKMVLLVLDGLGGLPRQDGQTELEAAATPHLDQLALQSELGLTHAVGYGITPGSGPAHLALFGYDPLRYEIGRGILEALGVGVDVGPSDLAVRGNFASLQDGLIVDRRAGRIATEKNRQLVGFLNGRIKQIEDVAVRLYSGEEHRFVLVLSGPGLSDALSDADPEANNLPVKYAQPKNEAAAKAARVVNRFIDEFSTILKDCFPANACLLRGFARYPAIPSLAELFKFKAAAIASYPMYRGLAKLVGMEILPTGKTIAEQAVTLKANFQQYDFFFVHIKKPDSYGEDGNFDAKMTVISEFDRQLPAILSLNPAVLVVTGDHSTPALMGSHSWHPNPFLLHSPFVRGSSSKGKLKTSRRFKFGESLCAQGILGNFSAQEILPLMMAHARKFKKYGA